MKPLFLLSFLLFTSLAYGQKKQCSCSNDSLMNMYTTDCATTLLKNGSKLYWQFNCDSIWLTLENKNGRKKIIDNVDTAVSYLVYRLGYQLVKEYPTTLLFSYGCPANGPCDYALLDKNTGKKLKVYEGLFDIPQPYKKQKSTRKTPHH